MKLSSKVKKKLRAIAHSIKPSIIIGKEGASEGCMRSINEALDSKELIKIKFNYFKDEKNKISDYIASNLKATVVGRIGNIIILFREAIDHDKRKFFIDEW